MSGLVIDASVALAWCFPDEASDYADAVLLAMRDQDVIVPAIWPIEIVNAVLVGERRKRIRPPEIRRFAHLLKGLNIGLDMQSVATAFENVLPLAEDCGLSTYDAAYLEVAVRHTAMLSTFDGALQRAARTVGVKVFKL